MATLDSGKQKWSAMADIQAYMVVGHQTIDGHFEHTLISPSLMSYQSAYAFMQEQAIIDGRHLSVEHEQIVKAMMSRVKN